MMWQWLRESKVAAYVLTILRIGLGGVWLSDGWTKLTMNGGFHLDAVIKLVLQKPVTMTFDQRPAFPWFNGLIDQTTQHGQSITALNTWSQMLVFAEIVVGLLLIIGALTSIAAGVAILLNLTYLGFGLIGVNPTELVVAFILLSAGNHAGLFGVDRILQPWFKTHVFHK